MNKLRLAVILILVVAVFAASLTLYYVATESEEDGFQEQFEADASIVLDSVEDIAMNKFQALSSLAVAFTAQAIANNNTWPFVTLNSFHERAASVRKISGALLLEILPIVTDDDRVEWEAYSVQRLGWVQGGRAYQKNEQGDANNAGKKLIRNLNGESSQLKEGSGLFQQPPPSPTLEGPALDFSASGSGNRIYSIDKNLSPYIDPGPGYYGTTLHQLLEGQSQLTVHVEELTSGTRFILTQSSSLSFITSSAYMAVLARLGSQPRQLQLYVLSRPSSRNYCRVRKWTGWIQWNGSSERCGRRE